MNEVGDIEKNGESEGGDAFGLWGALAALAQGSLSGGLEASGRNTAATITDAASVALALAGKYGTDSPTINQVSAGLGYSGLGGLGRRYGGPVLGFLIPDKKPAKLPDSATLAHAAQPPSVNTHTNNANNKPPAQEG